jgi:hypothetical protein
MIPISTAITKGDAIAPGTVIRTYFFDGPPLAACPLGAALIGSMRPSELETFWVFLRSASNESACEYIQRSLYRAWPHLGQSVRHWPKFADELERERLIPRIRTYQTEYRQEIHVSLWKVVTDLHDTGHSKGEIAELLSRSGL